MNLKSTVLTAFLLFCVSGSAAAQAPYVGLSLIGDIVRTTHAEGTFDGNTGSGESLGFGITVGAPVGSNWGVELEFVRPSEIESAGSFIFPLSVSAVGGRETALLELLAANVPVGSTGLIPFPSQIERRDRYTTLSPVLWANQTISNRVAFVYLGGVAFNRSEHEYGYAFTGSIRPISFSKTIEYGVRPVVGFESWIGLSDHLTLVPGIRLHGIQDGWLIRPAVGVSWSF